jgi:D-alanyl-D-alanine carboxypeptidase
MSAGQSYNGWPANSDPNAIDVDRDFAVYGVTFPGGAKGGDVGAVFTYLVEHLDAIEELVPGWCWGYEYRANVNNPSSLSCHASATALDYNAPDHPNGGSQYGGWTTTQVDQIRDLLAYLEVVDWGADFSGTKDPMHFEIDGTAAEVARIADKIGTQEDDMALSDDDKTWIQQTITNSLAKALTQDESVYATDVAATPNDQKYAIAEGIGRVIRLTALSATGQTVAPHPDK